MNKTQEKRLLNVARALRESPVPKAFDMSRYSYHEHEPFSCGTPACALGHYAARRDLQRNFRLTVEEDNDGSYYQTNIGFDDSRTWNHFGLDSDEAGILFGSEGCGNAKTPKQAARYIERFVTRKLRAQAK